MIHMHYFYETQDVVARDIKYARGFGATKGRASLHTSSKPSAASGSQTRL